MFAGERSFSETTIGLRQFVINHCVKVKVFLVKKLLQLSCLLYSPRKPVHQKAAFATQTPGAFANQIPDN